MNYTVNQLRIFLKIAQHQSITKAAEELNLTQPAVSIQLRNLQAQFDIALTEVIGRKLFVTEFGKEIAKVAEKILLEVETLHHKATQHKGELSGKLKIASVSTGKYVMPYFLTSFLQMHPNVDLVLDVTNKSKVIESLEQNEIDFALVSVLPAQSNIDKIALMPNLLYVVGNQQFAQTDELLGKEQLEKLPLIYREEGSGTRFVMERFLESNKIAVRKKFELTSNEAVKQAVLAGLGCSIMPLIGIKNELLQGDLRIIRMKGFPIKSTWTLIWLKDKRFSPAAQAYLHFLEQEKSKIIQERFSWLNDYR